MTDLCGPLQTELSVSILTESSLPIYTECFVPGEETTPPEETGSTGSGGRGRFRKVVGRRHGTYVYKIVRTFTEENF